MRAAVIAERGLNPVVRDFPEPCAQEGAILVDVETTGLGGWDILGAYRLGVEFPCVIRGEGVGRTEDGKRVYFGERSVVPFGSWAEKTLVPEEEVWDVPDDIDDAIAIAMGIAATGALLPLESANIEPGETVLILGATGTLGQIALQLARHLGAGKVVAAARNGTVLEALERDGLADAVVQLDSGDDVAAHKAVAGDGYDVVLDVVCGPHLVNALKATRWGARIMTIGTGAGREIKLDMADLLFKTLSTVGTGQRSPLEREQAWRRLLKLASDRAVIVPFNEFSFEDAAEAWQAQLDGPNAKIIATVK